MVISIADFATSSVLAVEEVTQADKVELQWFQPWHVIMYLAITLFLMIIYYQWKWERVVKKNALVLIQRTDGTPYSILVPKSEGSITLKDPVTGASKTWPINNNAFMDVLYPSFGFLPQFLLKKIKMTIVSEKDWEPILNLDPEGRMIASPMVLGSLIHEQFTAMLSTLTQDTMDKLHNLVTRMERMLDKNTFYIGIAILAIGIIACLVVTIAASQGNNTDDVLLELEKIKQALGIQDAVTVTTP